MTSPRSRLPQALPADAHAASQTRTSFYCQTPPRHASRPFLRPHQSAFPPSPRLWGPTSGTSQSPTNALGRTCRQSSSSIPRPSHLARGPLESAGFARPSAQRRTQPRQRPGPPPGVFPIGWLRTDTTLRGNNRVPELSVRFRGVAESAFPLLKRVLQQSLSIQEAGLYAPADL